MLFRDFLLEKIIIKKNNLSIFFPTLVINNICNLCVGDCVELEGFKNTIYKLKIINADKYEIEELK